MIVWYAAQLRDVMALRSCSKVVASVRILLEMDQPSLSMLRQDAIDLKEAIDNEIRAREERYAARHRAEGGS